MKEGPWRGIGQWAGSRGARWVVRKRPAVAGGSGAPQSAVKPLCFTELPLARPACSLGRRCFYPTPQRRRRGGSSTAGQGRQEQTPCIGTPAIQVKRNRDFRPRCWSVKDGKTSWLQINTHLCTIGASRGMSPPPPTLPPSPAPDAAAGVHTVQAAWQPRPPGCRRTKTDGGPRQPSDTVGRPAGAPLWRVTAELTRYHAGPAAACHVRVSGVTHCLRRPAGRPAKPAKQQGPPVTGRVPCERRRLRCAVELVFVGCRRRWRCCRKTLWRSESWPCGRIWDVLWGRWGLCTSVDDCRLLLHL